jgi:hypothetical protein
MGRVAMQSISGCLKFFLGAALYPIHIRHADIISLSTSIAAEEHSVNAGIRRVHQTVYHNTGQPS